MERKRRRREPDTSEKKSKTWKMERTKEKRNVTVRLYWLCYGRCTPVRSTA